MRSLAWICLGAALVVLGCTGDDDGAAEGMVGKSVGKAGGFVTSADGVLTIVLPPEALPDATLITIEPLLEAPASIGPAYRVRPNIDLNVPAVIAYRYALANIGDRDADVLTIGKLAGEQWMFLNRLGVDAATQQVSGEDAQLGFAYGLLEDSALDGGGSDGSGSDDGSGTGAGTTSAGTDVGESGQPTTADDGATTDGDSTDDGGMVGCGDGIVAAGELCLEPGDVLAVPTAPSALTAADLDGNGTLDLIAAGGGSSDVSVMLGNGDGTFFDPELFVTAAGPTAVLAHDVDADGNTDVLVAAGNAVSLLPGDGAGGLGAAVVFPVGNAPSDLLLGDFDEDGIQDVVSAAAGPGTISLLLGDGTSLADSVDFPLAATLNGIVAGDFNGDANLDIAAVDPLGVGLILGNGAALFGGASNIPLGGVLESIAVLDANEDGALDLAVAQSGSDTVTVLLGNGLGGFGGGVPYLVGLGPVALRSADLDGDGHDDLVAVGAGDDSVTVLFGVGNGSFDEASTFATGVGPTAILVADLNGDGALDLAITAADDTITLWLSDN